VSLSTRLATSLAVVAGAIGGVCVYAAASDDPPPVSPTEAVVRATLLREYVRPIDSASLEGRSVQHMLRSLRDPHTVYLPRQTYRAVLAEIEQSGVGLGVRIEADPLGLRVVSTVEGSPAARQGLAGGDLIVAIDGADARRMDIEGALARLRGPSQSEIELRVRRGAEQELTVTLLRARLHLESVTATDHGSGAERVRVIRITSFGDGAAKRVRQLASGQARLVLDLRGNPGGLLSEALATARLFVERGTIVSSLGEHAGVRVYAANGASLAPKRMAVLVDRRTASAAEIVAAAVQEHLRGTVIGTPTRGKASIQAIHPLPDGGALKVTIATFYTPAGRDLHGTGVQPDVRIAGGRELARALAIARAA